MVFEPIQGFHLGRFGGFWVILATGGIEEWAAGPMIGYELVVLLLDHQLRFQTRHSAVDASVLSGVGPQHRRLQVGYVLQWQAAAVERYRRPQLRLPTAISHTMLPPRQNPVSPTWSLCT